MRIVIAPYISPESLLGIWRAQLRTLHTGHWEAARIFDARNSRYGLLAAAMSAIAGTAAFTSLASEQDFWARLIAGVFAVVAAIVSTAQTYYKSSENAEKHRTAAMKFGNLRREFEQLLAFGLPQDEQEQSAVVSEIRKQWTEIEAESPAIPSRIYERFKRVISPWERGDEESRREETARKRAA